MKEYARRVSNSMKKRIEEDATALLFGETTTQAQPSRDDGCLTLSKLRHAYELLNDYPKEFDDSDVLVLCNPDAEIPHEVREWLWWRAAKGWATRMDRFVPLENIYKARVPKFNTETLHFDYKIPNTLRYGGSHNDA